jgi:non-heme chloroperoxidase
MRPPGAKGSDRVREEAAMKNKTVLVAALTIILTGVPYAQNDTSRHNTQFVEVEPNVNLEVLDWGGSGRALILLGGLGDTAHAFDQFATKLADVCHVYGITRRGFGGSSAPLPENDAYSADRLGDDILSVIEFLSLKRPVLVGHSIAGEELSSVASRHPKMVSGLIYLDAGYSYAYYDRQRGDYLIESLELRQKLDNLIPGNGPQDETQVIQELLETLLPAFETSLNERKKDLRAIPAPPATVLPQRTPAQAILAGQKKFTDIRLPALAIFAIPHDFAAAFSDPSARAAAEARDLVSSGAQAQAFRNGVPSARVVVPPHTDHFVFRSNEAEVLREISAFLATLPQ